MTGVFSPWLIWFLVGIAVILGELAVPGFVIIFFGLGCLGAAVVAAIVPDAYSTQVVAFLIVSLTCAGDPSQSGHADLCGTQRGDGGR